MKGYWTSMASLLGAITFCQTMYYTLFPPELTLLLSKFLNYVIRKSSSYCYFEITEVNRFSTNEFYEAVQLYLSSSASVTSTRVTLSRDINSTTTTFGLSNNSDIVVDTFHGVRVWWEHIVTPMQSQSWDSFPTEKRGFTLRVKKKDKTLILNSYLDFIMEKVNEISRRNEVRHLYTYSGYAYDSPWESAPLKHPSTFETLAMDPPLKDRIMQDLHDFANNGRLFYQKTGRAWKRGYLLYGPPGTGKSSMIAAMANFLGYDIYDLELSEVRTNSDLRRSLMKTTPKSIIVIEDIDCSVDLSNRSNSNETPVAVSHKDSPSITLSRLLNFTDGLWSCCGFERIFVFTTNHVEKLDPALLRRGRMDLHIYMGYCNFSSLKILLKNYLESQSFDDGKLKEVEELIDDAEMTPADISEILIENRRDKCKALEELVRALKFQAGKKRMDDYRESNPLFKEEGRPGKESFRITKTFKRIVSPDCGIIK